MIFKRESNISEILLANRYSNITFTSVESDEETHSVHSHEYSYLTESVIDFISTNEQHTVFGKLNTGRTVLSFYAKQNK